MKLSPRSSLFALSLLATGLPAQQNYTPFGNGCAGSNGVPLLAAAPGPLPRVDGVFTLQLSNLPAGNFGAFVVFGFSTTDWLGIPLPSDLSSVGMIGCTAYVSVDAAFGVVTAGGTAQFPITIPNDPSLLALHFFNQAVVVDPGVNFFGGVVSNAAEGIIGPRAVVPPTYDLTGTWTITETSGANTCGDPVGATYVYPITVTGNGNNLTIVESGNTTNWTVTGTSILWTGSFPEQGGTLTITSTSITATNANHFSGTIHWSWTDGIYPCSGTNSVSGVKQ